MTASVLYESGYKFPDTRLTVITELPKKNKMRHVQCVCDCGVIKDYRLTNITCGYIKSCGCFNKERTIETHKTHGLSGTRLYRIWNGMLRRCYEKNRKEYSNYGGRGITVCDEWRKFEMFHKWALENGYSDNLEIDRIDSNGNYESNNCHWITRNRNQLNKRNNHLITIDDKTMCITEWVEQTGLSLSTFKKRIKSGWSGKNLLLLPDSSRRLNKIGNN